MPGLWKDSQKYFRRNILVDIEFVGSPRCGVRFEKYTHRVIVGKCAHAVLFSCFSTESASCPASGHVDTVCSIVVATHKLPE